MPEPETTEKPDELEQAVDTALKAAYRDGPDWMALRKAVEAIKTDRRRLLSESPTVLFERLQAAMERRAENAATVIDDELTRIAQATEGFLGDVRSALGRFRRKQ